MAPDDSDTSEGMKKSLRDYWLQYYRQKKFILPEELEKDSGKTLEVQATFMTIIPLTIMQSI